MSALSTTAYITLFHAAFGVLGVVAMSSLTTIFARAEEHLVKKKNDGLAFLQKLEQVGLSPEGLSVQLYYNESDMKLSKSFRGITMRLAGVYVFFLLMAVFLMAASHWIDITEDGKAGILEDDWLKDGWAIILPAFGFTLWLVVDMWLAFRRYMTSLTESIQPNQTN